MNGHTSLSERLHALLRGQANGDLSRKEVVDQFLKALGKFDDAAQVVTSDDTYVELPDWFCVLLLEDLRELRGVDYYLRWTFGGDPRSLAQIHSDSDDLQQFLRRNAAAISEKLEARISE